MAKNKRSYWPNWLKDAEKHFNHPESTIVSWLVPRTNTPIMLTRHNELLDWVTETLIEKKGWPSNVAKQYVNKTRIGFEKCLED